MIMLLQIFVSSSSTYPCDIVGGCGHVLTGRRLCSGYQGPSEPGQCVGVCYDPLWSVPSLPCHAVRATQVPEKLVQRFRHR